MRSRTICFNSLVREAASNGAREDDLTIKTDHENAACARYQSDSPSSDANHAARKIRATGIGCNIRSQAVVASYRPGVLESRPVDATLRQDG
jgi:hypothetical protein